MKYFKIFMKAFSFVTGNLLNIAIVVVTVFLVYTFSMKAYDYGKDFMSIDAASKISKEITVVIPEGADAWGVAKVLKDNELIDNEFMFYIQARLNGTYKLYNPGSFKLNQNMDLNTIMDTLRKEVFEDTGNTIKVTFPEGLSLAQMALLLESKELFTAEEFLTACNEIDFNTGFLSEIPDRPKRIEGYLFPDTYFFLADATPEQVIWKMIDTFEEVYSSDIMPLASGLGLTMDEVVKMASIIEKEINRAEERVLASAVIHNRLKINMRLQMCSTVIYALDKRKDRLLYSDLEVDSPYNTYVHAGLPIGPISNPGKASLLAAVSPADVNYTYFVLKNEETGEHYFTNSFDDFLNAQNQYDQPF